MICQICGKEYTGKLYVCEECADRINRVKRLKMVDKARTLLERRSPSINYSRAIDHVTERMGNGQDRLASVPEVCAAVQMDNIGLYYESQKNVGGINVDFFIPEIRILLEVDGEVYHKDTNKAFLRDRRIMAAIGERYEIVHIPASLIPKYSENLRDGLKHVVYSRNHKWRFRDSEFDGDFLQESKDILMEYHSFEEYLKKRRRG